MEWWEKDQFDLKYRIHLFIGKDIVEIESIATEFVLSYLNGLEFSKVLELAQHYNTFIWSTQGNESCYDAIIRTLTEHIVYRVFEV